VATKMQALVTKTFRFVLTALPGIDKIAVVDTFADDAKG
jgi:hypothetical protein